MSGFRSEREIWLLTCTQGMSVSNLALDTNDPEGCLGFSKAFHAKPRVYAKDRTRLFLPRCCEANNLHTTLTSFDCVYCLWLLHFP
jgi:hypothetical protein